MVESATFDRLLNGLEEYLLYQQELGVRRVEVERSVLLDLKQPAASVTPSTPPPAPLPETFSSLEELSSFVATCQRCPLAENRTQPVLGEGNTNQPDVLFVTHAPNLEEDRAGQSFLGKSGQLLSRMIEAMGYQRKEIFISYVVKCHPPKNRQPRSEEMASCLPYLRAQIKQIRPKMIVVLGASALKGLMGENARILRSRGVWQEYEGIPMMPTFHPDFLLLDPSKKKLAWRDLKDVLAKLGKDVPKK